MVVYNLIDGDIQVCDVGMLAFLLKFLVDGLDGILLLLHLCGDVLTVEVLPEFQQGSGEGAVGLACFCRFAHGISSFFQQEELREVLCLYQFV